MTDLWGKIDISAWEELPCVRGRPATEEDVREGRAVFYVPTGSVAANQQLPFCALQKLEDGELTAVVAIQAELSDTGEMIVGVRYVDGGNGICTLPELVMLQGPNELFLNS